MFKFRRLIVAVGAASMVLFVQVASAQETLSLNLADALSETKAQLASGNSADIVVLGDSLSYRSGSYLPYFRDLMQGAYGNGGSGYQGFSLWTGGGFNSGWVNGQINSDTAPHHSLDGLWASSDAKPYPPTSTSARLDAWDQTIELQYITGPTAGQFRISLPGGQILDTIDAYSPTQELRTWSHTFTGENRRLWFQSLDEGERVTILGQNNFSDQPGVRVHRAANGGWGVEQFLQRDWTFDAQLEQIDPSLVMIWLGQNDQNYSQSAYNLAISQLVDRLDGSLPDADVVLIGTYDQGSTNLAMLVAAMQDVAESRSLGFINLYEAAGDRAFFDANGYLDDGIHFSHAGGQYLGEMLFDAFQSDGASLVPEPALLGPLALLLPLALARRSRAKRVA